VLQGVALLLFLPFDGLVSLYVISALFGLFQGGIVPSYAIIVREHFPPPRPARAWARCSCSRCFGMALGGWMSGKVFDLTGSYHAAFVNGIAWNLLNLSIAALKALCESALRLAQGTQATVVRPGLIVGPHDPTQRFTYWPARLARARDGEPVLAPGRPDAPVQVIDARDLAAFMLRLIDDDRAGVFHAVGETLTMGRVLEACAQAAGVRPDWRWIDMSTLQARGLQPWSDLPLALPDDAGHAGFMRTDARRARSAGLSTRPLDQTVADTLAWWRTLPPQAQVFDRAGLSPDRERGVLASP
jgi:hypothetical protein